MLQRFRDRESIQAACLFVRSKYRNVREYLRVLVSSTYCWRALARQLPILYNREKKAKSVGCKIGDLRSKLAFNIRGLLNVETCAVDYGCL